MVRTLPPLAQSLPSPGLSSPREARAGQGYTGVHRFSSEPPQFQSGRCQVRCSSHGNNQLRADLCPGAGWSCQHRAGMHRGQSGDTSPSSPQPVPTADPPHSLSHAGLVGGKVKIQKRQILPLGDINVSLPKAEDWKGEIELPAVPRGQKRQLAVLIKPE